MIDIYNLKQYPGEPFLTFLKRWRKKFSLYARPIPEMEKLEIFINNLVPEINYPLQMQDHTSFDKMVDNAIKIEKVLVKKGDITLQKDKYESRSNSKGKSKNWNKNKGIVIDGVVDNIRAPSKALAFNLTIGTQAIKASEKKVSDITYIRSAVESSDASIGFLPGSADEKMAFYNLPFMDKLDELLPRCEVEKIIKEAKFNIE